MQEMEVCEYQAWQQKLVLLFQVQIESVICVNLLEQKTWLICFELANILQNWQPVKQKKYFHAKQRILVIRSQNETGK